MFSRANGSRYLGKKLDPTRLSKERSACWARAGITSFTVMSTFDPRTCGLIPGIREPLIASSSCRPRAVRRPR